MKIKYAVKLISEFSGETFKAPVIFYFTHNKNDYIGLEFNDFDNPNVDDSWIKFDSSEYFNKIFGDE